MDKAAARDRTADDRAPELEWERLTAGTLHARLEYEVTTHALGRHLPPPPARVPTPEVGQIAIQSIWHQEATSSHSST